MLRIIDGFACLDRPQDAGPPSSGSSTAPN